MTGLTILPRGHTCAPPVPSKPSALSDKGDEVTETSTTPKDNADKEKRDKALRTGYNLAEKDLKENHRDEFNRLREAHTKALGYEWTPPKTAEEKAAEEMDALLSAFPHLRERIATEGEGATA